MIPDLPTIIAAGRLVLLAEEDRFLSDPASLDLAYVGYGSPTILWWTDPNGVRSPCGFIATALVGGKTVVICRGTEKIWEWLDDARFAQHQCPWAPVGCLVEEGFAALYSSTGLQDGEDFRPILRALDPASVSVFGHSLGAAWAAQCAGEIGAALCILFACPKVGNQALANYIEARVPNYIRPVNSHDVVPLMPCSFLGLLEYRNPGPELPLNSGGLVAHGPICSHHLLTYLALLTGDKSLVMPECLP